MKTLEIALRMRENGKSLERICELCEVPMASLIKILPGDAAEEMRSNSEAQVSHSIHVGPISEAEAVGVSSTEPAQPKLPIKRRAPSSAIPVSKRCKEGNKEATKTWPNGDSYQGQLLNDEPHGQGTKTWTNGDIYRGGWVDGKRQGRGEYKYSDARYEGEWQNNMQNGQGTLTWDDAIVYTGSWKDNKCHGHGVFSCPDGSRHEGE
jgi:hypothetical protein